MSGEGNEYGGLLFQSDDESNGGGGDSERNEASAVAADDDGNSSTTHLVDLIARLAVDDDKQPPVKSDLTSAIRRIGAPFLCEALYHPSDNTSSDGCIICNIIDIHHKANLIRSHMGNMAQCRGVAGDALREAGAIDALLRILWRFLVPIQTKSDDGNSSHTLLPIIDPISSYTQTPIFANECNKHHHLCNHRSSFKTIAINALHNASLGLAVASLGSLRDLACGSAANRVVILDWIPPYTIKVTNGCNESGYSLVANGIDMISSYVLRYHNLQWEEILSIKERNDTIQQSKGDAAIVPLCTERGRKELRLLTNALGVVRNASHSTPDNCQAFYEYGLSDLLVWRLSPDVYESLNRSDNEQTSKAKERCSDRNNDESSITISALPDATRQWREASYRAAGSLINLAEKCPAVASHLGSNRKLIYLLIETWGGANAIVIDSKRSNSSKGVPLLHLGLAAILHAANDGALGGGLDEVMKQVLEKEKIRKRVAQRKEEERKLRLGNNY